ncbi:hypothetical protein J0S82_020836 [Galemys pyrenaicus]|uniref:Uncharacterized protein n=1 Tax=Galemys pyrenaicus TaxID=202257 RepID=A0A8J6A778_GALPY|nr:hypothetical protein J0S82_020836 [Galemys pyrenaicus]
MLRLGRGLLGLLGTAVGPVAGAGLLRPGREKRRRVGGLGRGGVADAGFGGEAGLSGSAGGRAAQGVWLLEQFKVTLHIRALRPPLSDSDRGGASRLSAPLAGSAALLLPLAQLPGVWAAPARLAPDWLSGGGRVGRDQSAQAAADWCGSGSDALGVRPMGARGESTNLTTVCTAGGNEFSTVSSVRNPFHWAKPGSFTDCKQWFNRIDKPSCYRSEQTTTFRTGPVFSKHDFSKYDIHMEM